MVGWVGVCKGIIISDLALVCRYNSRINKLIATVHPNPWILLATLVKELLRSETEALWVKDSNPKKRKTSKKYQDLVEKRTDLMEKYAKKEIDEDFYLVRMGAVSLKLARVAHKSAGVAEEATENVPIDDNSDDSMSETRPLPRSEDSNSSSDDDVDVGGDAIASVASRLLKKTPIEKTNKKGDIFNFILCCQTPVLKFFGLNFV